MWMKTLQQDLKSNNLSLNEAIDVAQNRPPWRLMSTFGTMHSYWCMPDDDDESVVLMLFVFVFELDFLYVCVHVSTVEIRFKWTFEKL